MGYTHYFYTGRELPNWDAFAADARRILDTSAALGLKLAGPLGDGTPQVTDERLALNGATHCGHRRDERIVIPWPTPTARGIASEGDDPVAGEWFAGARLQTRACGGDCSYETFAINRRWEPDEYCSLDEAGRRFSCCKTAYRPYDVTVTALLIAAKRHFGDQIAVSSDGEDAQWADGRILCETACGYGAAYHLAGSDEDGAGTLEPRPTALAGDLTK